MTKRCGESMNNLGKKAKVSKSNNLADLWEDDLDDEVLDECFKIATQSGIDRPEETSILSYTAFRDIGRSEFTSTQAETTRVNLEYKISDTTKKFGSSESKLRELQQKVEEKEGEATNLRNQLRDLELKHSAAEQKRQQEFNEKLNSLQKEINSLKTHLEFKNLEIGNLREKLPKVSKRQSDVSFNSSQMCYRKGENVKNQNRSSATKSNTTCEQLMVYVDTKEFYPLKHLIESEKSLFDGCLREKYPLDIIAKSSYKNVVPYLENSASHRGSRVASGRKSRTKIKTRATSLATIYSNISVLLTCNYEALNRDFVKVYVNKLIVLTESSIYNLKCYLEDILNNCRSEDIQPLDFLYLTKYFDPCFSIEEEGQLGTDGGKCLLIMAELILYCEYARKCLIFNQKLEATADDCFLDDQLHTSLNGKEKTSNIFELLLKISTLIGQLRKSNECSYFLKAVVKFLSNICKICEPNNLNENFNNIFKEMLFSRPNMAVMSSIVVFLKNASKNDRFVNFLCTKSPVAKIKISLKKGVLYYYEDTCVFHVFSLLIHNVVLTTFRDNLQLHLNLLCLIRNMLQTNCHWLYYKEGKRCECLDRLYELGVRSVYCVLIQFKRDLKKNKRIFEKYELFFKSVIKVLSLLVFNSYDLAEKYITVYSQYKQIVHSLIKWKKDLHLSDNDINDLEKLNISEDIPNISANKINF